MKKLTVLILSLALLVTLSNPQAFATTNTKATTTTKVTTTAKETIIIPVPNPLKSRADMVKLNPEIGPDYDLSVANSKEVNGFIKTYLSSKYTSLTLSEKNMTAIFKTIGSDLYTNFTQVEVGTYSEGAYSITKLNDVWFKKGKTDKDWDMSLALSCGLGYQDTAGTVTEIRKYKSVDGATVYAIIGQEIYEPYGNFYVAFAGKSGKLIKAIGSTSLGFGYGVPAKKSK